MGFWGSIRRFGDVTGGRWSTPFRNSTWCPIGSMVFGTQYENVQYSKESCLQFGTEGTVCVFWSYDMGKMRSFYFACYIEHDRGELRVLNERTELLTGEYSNERIYDAANVRVVPFDRIPPLRNVAAGIRQLGQQHGIADPDSWFFQLTG